MNWFDLSILHFVNQFAHRSWLIDRVVVGVSGNSLIKGGVITAFLWWIWFRPSDDKRKDRQIVLAGLPAAVCALAAARMLALALPNRVRPVFLPELHFRVPYGNEAADLWNWSSFPSDHAALFFCLAATIWTVSRKAGMLAYLHTIFVVCLPRIYAGLHYPTDILASAVLGIGMAYAFQARAAREVLTRKLLYWLDAAPASFYACFYLFSLLLATNFEIARSAAVTAFHALKEHIGA